MKTCYSFITQTRFKGFLLLIISIMNAPLLVAQELSENDPNADYGLVYFIRGKEMMGSAHGFTTLIDDIGVCRLKNRSYTGHKLSPGEHTFKAQYGGKKAKKKAEVVLIDIEAGGTYYINLVVHTNYWWSDVTPREITRNSALRLFEDDEIKLDPDCGASEYLF